MEALARIQRARARVEALKTPETPETLAAEAPPSDVPPVATGRPGHLATMRAARGRRGTPAREFTPTTGETLPPRAGGEELAALRRQQEQIGAAERRAMTSLEARTEGFATPRIGPATGDEVRIPVAELPRTSARTPDTRGNTERILTAFVGGLAGGFGEDMSKFNPLMKANEPHESFVARTLTETIPGFAGEAGRIAIILKMLPGLAPKFGGEVAANAIAKVKRILMNGGKGAIEEAFNVALRPVDRVAALRWGAEKVEGLLGVDIPSLGIERSTGAKPPDYKNMMMRVGLGGLAGAAFPAGVGAVQRRLAERSSRRSVEGLRASVGTAGDAETAAGAGPQYRGSSAAETLGEMAREAGSIPPPVDESAAARLMNLYRRYAGGESDEALSGTAQHTDAEIDMINALRAKRGLRPLPYKEYIPPERQLPAAGESTEALLRVQKFQPSSEVRPLKQPVLIPKYASGRLPLEQRLLPPDAATGPVITQADKVVPLTREAAIESLTQSGMVTGRAVTEEAIQEVMQRSRKHGRFTKLFRGTGEDVVPGELRPRGPDTPEGTFGFQQTGDIVPAFSRSDEASTFIRSDIEEMSRGGSQRWRLRLDEEGVGISSMLRRAGMTQRGDKVVSGGDRIMRHHGDIYVMEVTQPLRRPGGEDLAFSQETLGIPMTRQEAIERLTQSGRDETESNIRALMGTPTRTVRFRVPPGESLEDAVAEVRRVVNEPSALDTALEASSNAELRQAVEASAEYGEAQLGRDAARRAERTQRDWDEWNQRYGSVADPGRQPPPPPRPPRPRGVRPTTRPPGETPMLDRLYENVQTGVTRNVENLTPSDAADYLAVLEDYVLTRPGKQSTVGGARFSGRTFNELDDVSQDRIRAEMLRLREVIPEDAASKARVSADAAARDVSAGLSPEDVKLAGVREVPKQRGVNPDLPEGGGAVDPLPPAGQASGAPPPIGTRPPETGGRAESAKNSAKMFFDNFRPADVVLERNGREAVVLPIRRASQASNKFLHEQTEIVRRIVIDFKLKQGSRDSLDVASILDGRSVPSASDNAQAAAERLREEFFNPIWMRSLEKDTRELILRRGGAVRYVRDYWPHIRDIEGARFGEADATDMFRERLPEELVSKLFRDRKLVDPGDYSLDLFDVIPLYMNQAKRTIFDLPAYDKALKALDRGGKAVGEMDEFLDGLSRWYADNFVGTVSSRDRVTASRLYKRTARFLGQTYYDAFIGGNPGIALINTTQTLLNTYPQLGVKHSLAGLIELGTKEGRKKFLETGLLLDYAGLEEVLQTTAGRAMQARPVRDRMLYLFRGAEALNRGISYHGALSKGRALGKTGQELENYATDMVERTQFAYNRASASRVLTKFSETVPGMAQFMSYPVRQGDFVVGMLDDIFRNGLSGRERANAIGRFSRFIGMAWALTETVGPMAYDFLTAVVGPSVQNMSRFANWAAGAAVDPGEAIGDLPMDLLREIDRILPASVGRKQIEDLTGIPLTVPREDRSGIQPIQPMGVD